MIKSKVSLSAVLALVIGFSLSGCETMEPRQAFPELTFQHLASIKLNVASLETDFSYQSPMSAPNVEHLFPTSPGTALKRWAKDRLTASGTKSRARFTIIDAAVRETQLQVKSGIKGAFTKDQAERYDAVLEASLEIITYGGKREGYVNAKVTRSVTVREDASVNEREQAWFSLTEALMKDIDAELSQNISRHLGDWLK